MKYILRLVIIIVICGMCVWGGARFLVYNTHGTASENKTITIPDGATIQSIAVILEKEKLIVNKWAFVLYARFSDSGKTLKAGTYTIAPHLTIPDIVVLLSQGKSKRRDKIITFPEGWRIEQMAERLTAHGFDGDAFEKIARTPPEYIRAQFSFLKDLPEDASLEGYLFPDTYNFLPETAPEDIIVTMLKNFDRKFTKEMRDHIAQFNQSIHEAVTLASIIEREVHVDAERPIVSGIFYNRLHNNMPLGSDATLDYIFGESKIKHTQKETQVDSPYNTYKNIGLPPGPICNPGESALRAAVYPAKTDYLYFLNNAQTGETVFARTHDEHVANKRRNGL